MPRQPFRVGDEITLINPLPSDPFFIQFHRTVKVIEVRGDWVLAENYPAPDNRQEYEMPASRFRPAEMMRRPS
jgi:hypothetical protein